jgi:hypothetical protein
LPSYAGGETVVFEFTRCLHVAALWKVMH